MRKLFTCMSLVFLAVTFSGQPADAGQLVVIDSTTPGLEPGQVMQSDTFLDVPDGYSVTLVSESGNTVTLNGPHSGPVPGTGAAGAKASKLVSSLAALLKDGGRETASLGAMRAVGPKLPPDDPWVVDIGHAGNHCVSATGRVVLWRSKVGKARVMTLKNLTDRTRASAEWPPETEAMEWPAGVSRSDGAEYLLGFKGSRVRKKLTLRVVPDGLPSDAHRAAWMADNGCEPQALRLLAKMR